MLRMGITIDAPSSRDLDDAIWCKKTKNGGYRISVFITDTTDVIRMDSEDDINARDKATNIYGDGHRETMLDEAHNKELSLDPHQIRDVMSVDIDIDATGKVVMSSIKRADFKSLAKMDYSMAERIIHDRPAIRGKNFYEPLNDCLEAARLLWMHRVKDMENLDDWKDGPLHKNGDFKNHIQPNDLAKMIVNEFMLCANTVVTNYMVENDIPIIFRNQVERPGERSGRYEITSRGHNGIGLEHYAQFTSPMRRYVDMINQRILLEFLKNKPQPYNVVELSKISAHANIKSQQADIIGRGNEYEQDIIRNMKEVRSLKRLNMFEYSRMLAELTSMDSDYMNEYRRRRDAGLLNQIDIARLIFSLPYNAYGNRARLLNANERSILLARVNNTPGLAQIIWQCAHESLGLKYRMKVSQGEDGWFGQIVSGSYGCKAKGQTYEDVKDFLCSGIMRRLNNLSVVDTGHILNYTDINLETTLKELCQHRNGEYEFKIDEKKEGDIIFYEGYITVNIDNYVFTSPMTCAPTVEAVRFSLSEMALGNIVPYCEATRPKQNVDISILEKSNSFLGLDEFCKKSGLDCQVMWMKENTFNNEFVARIELKHGDVILPATGYGKNKGIARNNAAKKIIHEITGYKKDMTHEDVSESENLPGGP